MKLRKFLIVRADGEVRIVSKQPLRLRLDEFAYRVSVTIPDSWASIVGEISIVLPDPNIAPSVDIDGHTP